MKTLFLALFLLITNISLVGDDTTYEEEKIVATSIPKCGSFLLYNCITAITGKNAWHRPIFGLSRSKIKWDHLFCVSYEKPSAKSIEVATNFNLSMLFIYRDPRDQVVSSAYFFKDSNLKNFNSLSIDELITLLIKDSGPCWKIAFSDPYYPSEGNIAQYYECYLPWKDHDFTYTTRFEDLIGSQGGGDDETQLQEVKNIAEHIGDTLSEEEAKEICQNLYKDTQPSHIRQIGVWKDLFTEEHKQLFKEIAGNLLIELGYETGLDW